MGSIKAAVVVVFCALAACSVAAEGPYTVGSGNLPPINVACCATVTYNWATGPHGITVLDNGGCSNSGSVNALGPIQPSGSVAVPFTEAGTFYVTDPLNCHSGLNQKVTVQACPSSCPATAGVNNNVNHQDASGNNNNNNGGNNNNPGTSGNNNVNRPDASGNNNNNNGGNNNNPGTSGNNNVNRPDASGNNNNNNGGGNNNDNPGTSGNNNDNNG